MLVLILYPVQDLGNELVGIVFTATISKVIFSPRVLIRSLLNFAAIGRIQFWLTLFFTS